MRKLLLFSLGAMLISAFSAKAAIDSTLCSVKLTVNMSEQIKTGAFVIGTSFVDVAGTFNGWDGANHHLVKSDADDSIYSIQIDNITLANLIEYKFRIDGVWVQGKSELWGSAPNRKLAPRPLKGGGLVEATKYFDNYRTGYVPVELSVNMSTAVLKGKFNPAINFLDVAGSFNGWNDNDQLFGDGSIYSATVLAPKSATIEYKFRIDGVWQADKAEFWGGGNRSFAVSDTVGGVTITVPTVYFNDEIVDVKSVLVVPTYPKVTDKIYVYINANYYGLNPLSPLSAYTGLVTSASNSSSNWQHQVADWGIDTLKLTRLNDSIHVFTINSIKDLYKVDTKAEDVFRVAFIARDTAVGGGVGKQTAPDIFFDIYGSVPTAFTSAQPAKPLETKPFVVTVNINQNGNHLADSIMAAAPDKKDVYAYTGVSVLEGGEWKHEVTPWSDVSTNAELKTMRVNDSVYRFYVMQAPRDFYKLTDSCEHIYTSNLVFRNAAGNAQGVDIRLQFDTASYKACEPIDTTINVTSLTQTEISIYPNPAVEKLTVKSGSAIKDITVSNIYGQQVMRLTNVNSNLVPVSINTIESGVYFISVRSANNQVISRKFIKR